MLAVFALFLSLPQSAIATYDPPASIPAKAEPLGLGRSASAPLFVRALSVEKTKDELRQERDDRAEKQETDRALARYTYWLMWGTVALAVFTLFLAYFAFKQSRDMKESIDVARENSKAAKANADAAKQMAETTLAAERAILIVEKVNISPGLLTTVALGNHGRTPALIKQFCLIVGDAPPVDSDNQPNYPNNSRKDELRHRIVDSWKNFYEITSDYPMTQVAWQAVNQGATALWAYGYVTYEDFTGTAWQYGFCCRFNIGNDGKPRGWVRGERATYTYLKMVEQTAQAVDSSAAETPIQ